jgi:hypothetical protein
MEIELENSIIAGNQVHFVYIDPDGNKENDFEFNARCHFLPQINDIVKIRQNKFAFVKKIYHAFSQADEFEEGKFFQVITVVLTTRPGLEDDVFLQ